MNEEEFAHARETAARLRHYDTAGHIYLTKALDRIEALETEVERLRLKADSLEHARHRLVTAVNVRDERLRELRRLAKTVAEHWDGVIRDGSDDNPLWGALDELARIGRRLP